MVRAPSPHSLIVHAFFPSLALRPCGRFPSGKDRSVSPPDPVCAPPMRVFHQTITQLQRRTSSAVHSRRLRASDVGQKRLTRVPARRLHEKQFDRHDYCTRVEEEMRQPDNQNRITARSMLPHLHAIRWRRHGGKAQSSESHCDETSGRRSSPLNRDGGSRVTLRFTVWNGSRVRARITRDHRRHVGSGGAPVHATRSNRPECDPSIPRSQTSFKASRTTLNPTSFRDGWARLHDHTNFP